MLGVLGGRHSPESGAIGVGGLVKHCEDDPRYTLVMAMSWTELHEGAYRDGFVTRNGCDLDSHLASRAVNSCESF